MMCVPGRVIVFFKISESVQSDCETRRFNAARRSLICLELVLVLLANSESNQIISDLPGVLKLQQRLKYCVILDNLVVCNCCR